MSIAFLFVTCCLEQSRTEILKTVVANINDNIITITPDAQNALTVFDNGSSAEGVSQILKDNFINVYKSERNVGYWSAIDWWLESLSSNPPTYTYIIESDMVHYDFAKFAQCEPYLDANPDVGSIRLHEYSVAERHLFNKDAPRADSRRGLWQSHTNKVTKQPVKLDHSSGDIWSTTFLTQLPAFNRYTTMREVFAELRAMGQFTEFDFQRLYWQRYQRTGIMDGGIFHCNLNPHGSKAITGSWTSEEELKRIGYQPTRKASIVPREEYNVVKL